MELIDTHAHIFLDQFVEDIDLVIHQAKKASIGRIYMPNIDVDSIENMINIEDMYPGYCYSMIGLHPCSVNQKFENQINVIDDWLSTRRFAGIGETGTDLYWDKTFFNQQIESLEIHISWAKEHRLPIILHSRESLDETISIIEKNHDDRLKGIFHCFTGNKDQAERIIAIDFLLGIGGVLTFKNTDLDKIINELPLTNIVLETDSPYLAPMPYRGKRNEPKYIPFIASKLAGIFGITVNEVAKITSENAKKAFENR